MEKLKFKITGLFLFVIFSTGVSAQTKVSTKSGDWSDPTAWSPSGVPASNHSVIIAGGHTITFDVNGSCAQLIIGNGSSVSSLRLSGNTDCLLTVAGGLTVQSQSTLRIRSSSNATHTLSVGGNILNNGSIDLNRDANSLCELFFVKNGNQLFSGTGVTDLFMVTANLGTSLANVLDINCAGFTAVSDFLRIKNGTVKISVTSACTLIPFITTQTLTTSSGLWLNSAYAVLSTSAGISLAGRISVSAGTLTIGNAADEDLAVSTGTIDISGGSTGVAGKITCTAGGGVFSMSGGTLTLSTIGSSNTTIAPFHFSSTGSQVNFTGGNLVLRREGGSGTQDLGFVNTSGIAGSVNGGTLQIGDNVSPASQTITINSTRAIPNLVVNSASVTVKLASQTTILNDLTIMTGTIQSNNQLLNVGGDWNNSALFVPGTGTVNFNGSAIQLINRAGGETFNKLVFNGSGLKTFSSLVTTNSDITVSSGASLNLGAVANSLTARGHIINDGSVICNSVTVLLTGSSSQSISGTTPIQFYDLVLNNTAGAVLGSEHKISGSLLINNGTFNTNGKVFTLLSDASSSARIGPMAATGNLLGDVTIQRYVPGGSTGWALIGSPISSSLTFSGLDDDLYITCPSCPDGSLGGFTSVYSYNESVAGSYDAAASYAPISSIFDPLTFGKGYWMYIGTSQFTTTGVTLDATGTPRKFNSSMPLSYSNSGSAVNDGWNLIHNPLPSPISWSLLRGATANVDNAIYVYNTDLNGGTGGYASCVNGISSPAIGSGGIGNVIPMWQGFYVHCTASATLAVSESVKTSGNNALLKSTGASSNYPLIRLNLQGGVTNSDELVLYFENAAAPGFDASYDAYKMRGQDPLAPYFASECIDGDLQINSPGSLLSTTTFTLKALTGFAGQYTISAQANDLPFGTCLSLYDRYTGKITDLQSGSCVIYLSDTTTTSRFLLTVAHQVVTGTDLVVQPSCPHAASGLITSVISSPGPWNYRWTKNDSLVRVSTHTFFPDTLSALSDGIYKVEIASPGQCASYTSTLVINPVIIPKADFMVSDTLLYLPNSVVNFVNKSSNAAKSSWDFGTNADYSNSDSPTFSYKQAGEYMVQLHVESSSTCTSVVSKKIQVLSSVGFSSLSRNEDKLKISTLDDNKYRLSLNSEKLFIESLELVDISGKKLLKTQHLIQEGKKAELDLNGYTAGIISLRCVLSDKSQKSFLLVVR